jgi:hypothetical protein
MSNKVEDQLELEIEKPKLEVVLPIVLTNVLNDKEKLNEVDGILINNYKIPRGTVNELIANFDSINQLSEVEVSVLTKVLFDVTKDSRINPTNFYNQKEINKALKYKGQDREPLYPMVLRNVSVSPDGTEFSVCMTLQDIARSYIKKIWTYNFNAQRLSKKKMLKGGKISEKIDIKAKSVKEIRDLMKNGKYKADAIFLNVLVDGNDNIEYDADEMTLTIHEGTVVNLIDGMHRTEAAIQEVEENPDTQGFLWVIIKHYPISDSQFMLGQVNKKNAFDKTLIKHYMGEDFSAQITKDLMYLPELKNKISIKTTIDKNLNYFTNYAILSEAIESIFSPQNSKDRYDYLEVLKKYFSYMISHYSNQLTKDYKILSKSSWFTHHNIYVGHIAISKALYDKYGKDFPVDMIPKIIDSIDLSKNDNSEFNLLMSSQGKVNSNQVKRSIRKFFEDKVTELLK